MGCDHSEPWGCLCDDLAEEEAHLPQAGTPRRTRSPEASVVVECYGVEADCWPTVALDGQHLVMKCRRHGHTWVSEAT